MGESAAEDVKLLTHWVTLYGQRVEIALKLKGVPYEAVEVQMWPEKPQLLLDANPVHKKIPVLIHKGRPLAESMVILEYVEDTWPQPSLFPADAYERATARFWADFIAKLVGASVASCRLSRESIISRNFIHSASQFAIATCS